MSYYGRSETRSLPPKQDSIDAFELSDDEGLARATPSPGGVRACPQRADEGPQRRSGRDDRTRYFAIRGRDDGFASHRHGDYGRDKRRMTQDSRTWSPHRRPLDGLEGNRRESQQPRENCRQGPDHYRSWRDVRGPRDTRGPSSVGTPTRREAVASPGTAPSAPKDFSKEFEVDYTAPKKEAVQRETDPHRLSQRQKQIDIGKNTRAYTRYCELVPKHRRRWFGKKPVDPATPDIAQICSKRSFDGQIRVWRRMLHEYDPPADEDEEEIDLAALANPAPPPQTAGAAAAEIEDGDGCGSAPTSEQRTSCAKRSADAAALDDDDGPDVHKATAKAARYEEDPEDYIYLPQPTEPSPAAAEQDDWDIDDVAI